MKFKVDENLPVEVVDLLVQSGHDALGAVQQQLSGRPDLDIANVCQAEHRAIVTLDLDFSDIRAYPPNDYFGIVVLRPTLQTITSLLRLMVRVAALLDAEPLIGRLWVADDHQVRIRG